MGIIAFKMYDELYIYADLRFTLKKFCHKMLQGIKCDSSLHNTNPTNRWNLGGFLVKLTAAMSLQQMRN